MSKRYVLLLANAILSEEDVHRFSQIIGKWHPDAKVIKVKGNRKALIVKTTNLVAPSLRELKPGIRVGRIELVSILTSGAIGNLKKRASEAAANDEVP